jgi:hypothetical protein
MTSKPESSRPMEISSSVLQRLSAFRERLFFFSLEFSEHLIKYTLCKLWSVLSGTAGGTYNNNCTFKFKLSRSWDTKDPYIKENHSWLDWQLTQKDDLPTRTLGAGKKESFLAATGNILHRVCGRLLPTRTADVSSLGTRLVPLRGWVISTSEAPIGCPINVFQSTEMTFWRQLSKPGHSTRRSPWIFRLSLCRVCQELSCVISEH